MIDRPVSRLVNPGEFTQPADGLYESIVVISVEAQEEDDRWSSRKQNYR